MAALSFDFPVPLTERYRPRKIQDFCGLEKPKKVLSNFVRSPRATALLFSGPAGTGKTSMALAVAEEMSAELHHIGSQECNLERLQRVCETCSYVPMEGKRVHLVLIDECDSISQAAQKYLLSRLDSTEALQGVIWIFTTNNCDALEPRFVSRCLRLDFSSYAIQSDAAALLERIWTAEAPNTALPNFARIIKEACGNVREALQVLDRELLMA